MASTPEVKIAKVDCSQFDPLCNTEGIDGYPTLNLYKNGQKVTEYEGERTLQELHDFLLEHIDPKEELKKDEL